MDLSELIIGIVQGITEFLPISSSAHMIIVSKLFNSSVNIISAHIGTLIPIIIYFRNDIFKIIKAFFSFNTKDENFKLLIYIIIGNIPTIIIYLLLRNFNFIKLIPFAFIFTGILLLLTYNKKGSKNIDLKSSLLIGLFQGISIIPGISRLGATISIALLKNIKIEEAFKFSFLLFIPIIIGGIIIETNLNINIILISMIFGFIGIYILKKLLNRLYLFSIYCFLIAVISYFII
ncbi:MAG: UDP-diphosphatase [Candidatus Methanomethylicota archaeon]|uniref:Undecaprenyl-diphosphatase n=1 Tax=Thermoproteota archaeon TaxID=2056631 RepID=A0A523BE93_9CREN|nr:MAG: undecaprenyl-diphosphate phosphatase [Candidatus Verstraetearchaeota archaeon]TDA39267.1 MAG: UDP-diphosphatase [Candidatus Verstraetearchaeota archaeon]